MPPARTGAPKSWAMRTAAPGVLLLALPALLVAVVPLEPEPVAEVAGREVREDVDEVSASFVVLLPHSASRMELHEN